MRGRTQQAAEEAEVNMTPMLDVVFILLIFFIVTANFDREQAMVLEPPPPPSPDQPTDPVPTIIIYVDDYDRITVNSRSYELSGIRPTIERLRAEEPDSAVIIMAHPDARNETLLLLRDKAYDANVDKVNILLSGG